MKASALYYCVMQFAFYTSCVCEFTAIDENILFKINWPGPLEETSERNLLKADGDAVFMTTTENEQYKCILPSRTAFESQDSDSSYSGPNAMELLRPLFSKNICTYKLEQYWAYELCHGQHLRQFHERKEVGKETSLQEYYLGYYDMKLFNEDVYEYVKKMNEKDPKEDAKLQDAFVKVDGNRLPFVTVHMTDGTMCDLNGKPRVSHVRYMCFPDTQHEIYSLEETSTCEYDVIVLTPLLCVHPTYRLKTLTTSEIQCHALGNTPKMPVVLQDLEEESTQLNPYSKLADLMKQLVAEQDVSANMDSYTTVRFETGNEGVSTPDDPKLVQDFLNGDHCLYGGTGWWKYEFCYGKKVEQYHQESGGRTTVILLGTWDRQKHIEWIEKHPHKSPTKPPKNSISHYYSNGDQCAETGQLRHVEVRLRCKENSNHPNAVSMTLLEPAVCEYILVIESPIMCYLLPKADQQGLISDELK